METTTKGFRWNDSSEREQQSRYSLNAGEVSGNPSTFPAVAHRFFRFYTAFEMRKQNLRYHSLRQRCTF